MYKAIIPYDFLNYVYVVQHNHLTHTAPYLTKNISNKNDTKNTSMQSYLKHIMKNEYGVHLCQGFPSQEWF